MNNERVVKKISESKADGRRRMGRPRLRWLEDAEKDLRETKVKKDGERRHCTEKNVIKEVRALRESKEVLCNKSEYQSRTSFIIPIPR
jgi:hypothetical protein